MTDPQADPGSTIIVIPAFNEQAALPQVLADLRRFCAGVAVVVVDDGSTDHTAAVARQAGGNVAVVRLPFNMGIGGALRAGFRYAAEHGHHTAVQVDADGQHHAKEVERLLAESHKGAHLVIGNRFGAGDYKVGAVRGAAMAVLRLGVRLLCRRRFADPTSGFRAVSEPLLSAFAAHYPVEYMDSTETLVAACRAGYRVTEAPVTMGARAAGKASVGPLRLVYHYARLGVALAGGARSRLPSP